MLKLAPPTRLATRPTTVVGVTQVAGDVGETDGFIGVIYILAALNVFVGVFNMFPLLPLDGGHVVVALWDGLRRAWAKLFRRPPPAPVDATRLVPLTVIVAVLLIGMGALLLVADLFNPVKLFG